MSEFNPAAYLADEDEGFNPAAYLAEPVTPITPKESFLQKLGRGAETMFRPEVKAAEYFISALPGTQTLTRKLFQPVSKGIGAIQGAIASSPTAETLASPFKTALSVGKGAADILSETGISPLDVLLPFVGKLRFALKAPEAIRATEIAKIQAQAGPKVFQEAVKKLPAQEAMTVAELAARTGTPEKARAAVDFVTPSRFTNVNRVTRPLQKPVAPTGPKPFSLGAGLPQEEQAALDAFRAKLPQPPAIRPTIADTPPSATIKPVVKPSAILQPSTPEQTMIEAMKGFKQIRGQQNILLSKERAKRFAEVSRIGETVKGKAGYIAKLKALKGEMGNVQFESIANKVDAPTQDWIFQKIADSPILTEGEKLTASRGVMKMLNEVGGKVPQDKELEYLAEVFSPAFMEAIPKGKATVGSAVNTVGNLMKSMRATLDVSIPLRQGFFFIGKPKQWIPAFGNMYKYVLSDDAFNVATKRIQAMPRYKLMRESGLSLPKTEEVFMSDWADKIPGFNVLHKASKRAASGFLNDLRASVFNDLAAKAEMLKVADPDVYKNISKFVNAGSGRGSLGAFTDATSILNQVMFSPQLLASRLNLLNPMFYAKLDPFTRKEALKSLLTIVGAGMSVLGIAKLSGAEVGDDDRSTDFGKIKIGDTRFDIWGGFQQPIVAAARLLRGQMVSSTTGKEFELGEGYKPTTRKDIAQRFIESKLSPIAAFANGILKGQTAMGEKFNIPAEAIEQFIPMLTEDMMDLYEEWGPMGLLMAIPGAHGVGSQTYGDQVPVREITKTGAEKIRWKQKANVGEKIVNLVKGTTETNIPEAEQKTLVEERKAKNIENIQLDKVRKQVLETGEPKQFNGKLVYLERGILRTKDLMPDMNIKNDAIVSGVSAELRNLGIVFTPNANQAKIILDNIIKNPAYKFASNDKKKEVLNRFILIGGQQ